MLSIEESNNNPALEFATGYQEINSHFLIDQLSLSTIIFFICCLFGYILLRNENPAEQKTFHQCNKTISYNRLHVDLRVDRFSKNHQNMKIWIAEKQIYNPNRIELRPINFTVEVTTVKNNFINSMYQNPKLIDTFKFSNSELSEKIFVSSIFVNSTLDATLIHMILESDFKNIEGLYIYWQYTEVTASEVVVGLKLLLIILSIYLTYHSFSNYVPGIELFTQISCISLGLLSCLSNFPLSLFFDSKIMEIPQVFFTPIMVSFLRYVILTHIQLEAEKIQNPSMKYNIFIIIFSFMYCITDLALVFSSESNISILYKILNILKYLYVVFSVLISIIAFLRNKKEYSKRFIFICSLDLLSFFLIFEDKNYKSLSYMDDMPPNKTLSYRAAHTFMTSYILILLQVIIEAGYDTPKTGQFQLLSKNTSADGINLNPYQDE